LPLLKFQPSYYLLFEVSILLLCIDNQGFALKQGIVNCYEWSSSWTWVHKNKD